MAALVALLLVANYIPAAAGTTLPISVAVSVLIVAMNVWLVRTVRRERETADEPPHIPGLASARSERALTRRFATATFPDLWSSGIAMATWLVDWHLYTHPSAWVPRIADLTDGYQPWAVDLVALALVDTARAEHRDAADGSGISGLHLEAAAQRLTDPRTAFETLHRSTDVPVDTGRRLASLELLHQRTGSGPTVASAEIDGSSVEVWEQQPEQSNEAQEAALFTVSIARQVLGAHAHQTPHGRLGDRFPALARLEMVQRATDHAPRTGPYKGAPPLNAHRREAARLAQDLAAERRRTGAPVPPSRMRAYLLLVAVCEDRAALLWGERPPEQVNERAEYAARRLVDWDTAHPSTAPTQREPECRAEPRTYVRHTYTLRATRSADGPGPR